MTNTSAGFKLELHLSSLWVGSKKSFLLHPRVPSESQALDVARAVATPSLNPVAGEHGVCSWQEMPSRTIILDEGILCLL